VQSCLTPSTWPKNNSSRQSL